MEKWLTLADVREVEVDFDLDDCCYELSSSTMSSKTYQKVNEESGSGGSFSNLTSSGHNQAQSQLCWAFAAVTTVRHALVEIADPSKRDEKGRSAKEWLEKGGWKGLMSHHWMLCRFLFCAYPRSFEGLAEDKAGGEFKDGEIQTTAIRKCIDRMKHKTLLAKEGWKYLVINQYRRYPFFAEFVDGPDEYCGWFKSGLHCLDYDLVSSQLYHPSVASFFNNQSSTSFGTFDDVLNVGGVVLSSVAQFSDGESVGAHQMVLYGVQRGQLIGDTWDFDHPTSSGNWTPDPNGEEYYCFKNSIKADSGSDHYIVRIPKNRLTVTQLEYPQLPVPIQLIRGHIT